MQRVVSSFRVFVYGPWIRLGVLQQRIDDGRPGDPRGFLPVGMLVGAVGNVEAGAEREGGEGSEGSGERRERGEGREGRRGNRE